MDQILPCPRLCNSLLAKVYSEVISITGLSFHHRHDVIVIRSQCISSVGCFLGPSIKYVTLEGEGSEKVTVCDRGGRNQEHVTSHSVMELSKWRWGSRFFVGGGSREEVGGSKFFPNSGLKKR